MKRDVAEANFDAEVLQSDLPVLVDFGADWCAPCKMMEPVLTEISTDLEGKLVVAEVDVDQNPELASRYNVVSLPTLLLFHGGEVVGEHIGAAPTAVIREFVSPVLK
ncbi:MAG: thioredoxin [Alkalispirochaeta sp.]|jgi:thioredoxin 1